MASYTEFKTADQTNLAWIQSWDLTNKVPAVAKRIWGTYADALAFINDINSTAIPGIRLSVINDEDPKKNGLYFVAKVASAADANDGVLEKVGDGTGSIAVENYSAALSAATADNLGQIIYAKNDDAQNSGATAGPYIVIGVGEVAKLGTTTATGDIAGDVNTIKGDVSTIKSWAASAITTEDIEAIRNAIDEEFVNSAITIASGEIQSAIISVEDKVTELSGVTETIDGKFADYATSADTVAAIGIVDGKFADYATSADTVAEIGKVSGELATLSGAVETVDGKFADYATSADTNAAILDAISASVITVEKLETAESGYIATYEVKQNGVKVGTSINIPKDFLVKSASINSCTSGDTPVEGYVVGDKYIDFVVNTVGDDGVETHIYLNVKDLVDVYTGSTYVNINSGNGIEVKYDELKTQLSTDLGISSLASNSALTELSGSVVDNEEVVADAIASLDTRIDALEGLSGNSHTHSNKDVLDGITSGDVQSWNAAQANVLEGVQLNGEDLVADSDKKVNVLVDGSNVKTAVNIEGDVYSAASATSIDSVLQDIYDSLNGVKKDSISEFTSSDSSVTITKTSGITGSSIDVVINKEQSTAETVKAGHLEIVSGTSGIYGIMYYLEDDTE